MSDTGPEPNLIEASGNCWRRRNQLLIQEKNRKLTFCFFLNFARFLFRLRKRLEQLARFTVFGFNSGRFDLPVLLPYIVNWATRRGIKMSCLKRTTSFISFELGAELIFKDSIMFNCPVTLEKFIR